MGPYAWTPMTTRTAVGFGLDTHGSHTITKLQKTRPESAPGLRIRYPDSHLLSCLLYHNFYHFHRNVLISRFLHQVLNCKP